jgi:hypothetical protein
MPVYPWVYQGNTGAGEELALLALKYFGLESISGPLKIKMVFPPKSMGSALIVEIKWQSSKAL